MPVIEAEPQLSPSVEPTLEQLRVKRTASSVLALRQAMNEPNPDLRQAIHEYVYNQETTSLCERLDGVVKTELDFEARAGRLFAVNETGPIDWEDFHENNWLYANLLAAENPHLRSYLKIAAAEVQEGIVQTEIVKAGEPKTMVALSLCGDDILNGQALKKLGRDATKQRAMLRISVFDGQKLKLYTRSMDNMSLEAGKHFMKSNFGIDFNNEADSADVLSSRAIINGAYHGLADELVPPQTGINTYEFVKSQPDLLRVYLASLEDLAKSDLDEKQLAFFANELFYDIIASFEARQEGKLVLALADSITSAGDQARQAGKEYGGCDDVVVSLQSKTGLGIKSGEISTDCVQCPSCSKVVNLDKEYFRAGFLRCPNCKATKAYKKDAKLPVKNNKRYNEIQEGFYEWWTRQKQTDKLRRQQQAMVQAEKKKPKTVA